VYRLARQMLGNDADAEDVTQDVWLQVVRKLSSFRGESAFPTWLHRVTVNAALSYRHRQTRHLKRQVELSLELVQSQHNDSSNEPDSQALYFELRQQLESAIAQLPVISRDVFVLADVEERPLAEIGGLLCLKLGTVRSRLHRARRRVRDALARYQA
jgi:RNA polymerase sigma-70 factor (ECF subfamily)